MQRLRLNWNPITFKMLGVVFATSVHDTVLINSENKLKETRKLLSSLSRRNRTPLGKITVIKTSVISKVIHLFITLPDPESLWDGKFHDKL